MKPRAILFDYVHTLADSGDVRDVQFRLYAAARRRLVRAFPALRQDIPFMLWHVFSYVNSSYSGSYRRRETAELDLRALFVQAFEGQRLPLDDGLLDEIVALNHSVYAERLVVPSATREALERLKREGFRLGVVSNSMFQRRWTTGFPLLGEPGLLDAVVLSSEAGVRKPADAIYRQALDQLGVGPSEAVFVGDRLAEDVRAPKALGVPLAFLTHEFRQEPDSQGEADGILRTFPDLLGHLLG